MDPKPTKIGLIAELTGPLSFMGIANANLTTMLVDDINAKGGLLGRPVELVIEDGETIESVAKAKAAKLVDVDKVDVVIGGIYMTRAVRNVLHGPLPEKWNSILDASHVWRKLPYALLLASLFVFGFWPKLLTDKINPDAEKIVAQIAPAASTVKQVVQADNSGVRN